MLTPDKSQKLRNSLFVRNLTFGVEDGLVSTIGFVSGIAAAGMDKATVLLSGLILIFVEAFSMGIGSFLSENSAEEYEASAQIKNNSSILGGVIMFVSYLLAGFIIVLPYLFTSGLPAIAISVLLATISLLGLGYFNAKISNISPGKRMFKMVAIGGGAIVIGVLVGKLFHL